MRSLGTHLSFLCRMTETMTSRFPKTADTIMKHMRTTFTTKSTWEGDVVLAHETKESLRPPPSSPPESLWNWSCSSVPVDCVEMAATD